MSKNAETKFDIDVDAISHDELKAFYRRLLASRNSARDTNKGLTKWQAALSEAVTVLACQGSLAFQLMAEKAGVRSHPSVTAAVQLFDMISHPQWRNHNTPLPKVDFPEDWELDDKDAQSGDADMSFNAPIAEAIERLEALRFSTHGPQWKIINDTKDFLQKALHDGVEGYKDHCGFHPKQTAPLSDKHFRDMDADELRDLASALGWMALDVAQDMHFANTMLRRDLRAAAYRRVCADLYGMSQMAIQPEPGPVNVKTFGADDPEIPI